MVEADWDLGIGVITYEWCKDGVPAQRDMLQCLPMEKFPRWRKALRANKPVVISDLQRLEKVYPDAVLHAVQNRQPCKKPVRSALKEVSILAYVTVPKDLTKIKSKMLLGLTKRQLVCFGSAALVGVPLFFLSKGSMGTTSAALCMILVMLPFFLFALYEKNGQTLEVILGHLIQCKFIRPKRRIYQTNNAYSALVRQAKLEKEVQAIAEKSGKTGKSAARRKA